VLDPPPHAGNSISNPNSKAANPFRFALRLGNPIQINAGNIKDASSHADPLRRNSPEAERALIVSVEDPVVAEALSATDEGLTEQEMFAVAVDGTAQVRPTVPANPLDADTVTVEVPV
jgi:hypothetical protein